MHQFRSPLPAFDNTELTEDEHLVSPSEEPTRKLHTPKKSPFSSTSPFRSPFHSSWSSENAKVEKTDSSQKIKFYNKSTIQAKFIWKPMSAQKDEILVPVNSASNVYHTNSGLKIEGNLAPEVLELFEGLKEEDLFSQRPTPVKQPSLNSAEQSLPPLQQPPPLKSNKSSWNQPTDFSVKVSTCELEFDCHISFVINSSMKRTEFGAELWEEERVRCIKKSLPMDQPPSLPSTQTVNRTQQQTEKDFYSRFERLQLKGVMLRKTAKEMILSRRDPNAAVVLSQYLTANDLTTCREEIKSAGKTKRQIDDDETAFSQWASQAIEKAREDAHDEEQLFRKIAGDVGSIIEDYVKSQKSQTAESFSIKDTQQVPQHLKAMLNEDEEGMDGEDTEDSINQELEDIMASTQVEAEKHARLTSSKDPEPREQIRIEGMNTTTISSATVKPPLPPRKVTVPSAAHSSSSDSPLFTDQNLFPEPPYRFYSTPSDDSSSLGIAEERVKGLSLPNSSSSPQIFNSPAVKASATILIDPSTSITIGKRSLGDNKLTSIFKKQKVSPSATENQTPPKRVKFMEKDENSISSTPVHRNSSNPPTFSSASKEQQLVGVLLKSAEKKKSPDEIAEKKKFKKSVSFMSKAVNINIEPISEIAMAINTAIDSNLSTSNSIHETQVISVISNSSFDPVLYQPTKSLYICPTFNPPSQNELEPLENYGLSLYINPVPRFSLKSDAKEHQKFNENQNTNYNQYMMTTHKVFFDKDLPDFTLLTSFIGASSSSVPPSPSPTAALARISASTKVPNRSRCLIPIFSPPKPEKFLKENLVSHSKLPLIPSSAASVPSAVESETQSSDTSNYLLGASSDYQEKMHRLVVLSMELHCKTRKELLPNPKYDAIEVIVWVCDDIISNAENEQLSRYSGVLMLASVNSTSTTDSNLLLREIQMYIRSITSLSSTNPQIQIFSNEIELIQGFCQLTREIIDPDFLIGFESTNQSYGYLIKRGKVLNLNILQLLSRVPEEKPSFRNEIVRQELTKEAGGSSEENDKYQNGIFELEETNEMYDQSSIIADVGIFIKGRTFLNAWNLLRSELKLWNSPVHYAAEHILQMTLPFFTPQQLTKWYSQPVTRYKTIAYIYLLTVSNLLLVEKLDLMRKISECARLYGIDFFSVFHRGSQYRVEASLLVKAHVYDYLLITPSKTRVANQAAMEVIPLVLEPKSRFYTDPVLVLDYQSLYPSMMLAYNLCYSTCMGKLKPGSGNGNSSPQLSSETTGRLGVINYPEEISAINATLHVNNIKKFLKIKEHEGVDKTSAPLNAKSIPKEKGNWKIDENTPYVSPNGSIFCAKSVRQGILPIMIREMLNTRLMVKRSMKKHTKISLDGKKHNKVLEKVLDARQLAIKLLANVTCKFLLPTTLVSNLISCNVDGYTGAGFSGRMPMAELADAIVQSARSLLEWTIRTINSHPKWKAEVVYGDTDSVFVHLPGRDLQQAFKIGEEIALEITSKTPEDVVLKFEKVYYPCVLVSKKRYVGNCYEYPPPSQEILSRVTINPKYITIPRQVESLMKERAYGSTRIMKENDIYGKNLILSLLEKYSLQTKANNYLFIDAKGIEMIRSDQCLLTQKIQKEVLILLFTTFGDLSLLKSYLILKWQQILQSHQDPLSPTSDNELERVSFKDYIFNKEVKFGTYASVSSQPPGAIVATKEVLVDEMAIPPYNWKVPYVVVYGLPNTPLKNLVYHPKDVLKRGSSLRINYFYYITKCVNPALDRLLSLAGVNIFQWFQAMTRPKLLLRHINYDLIPRDLLPLNQRHQDPATPTIPLLLPAAISHQQQMSMEQFILQRNCLLCELNLAKSSKLICESCTTTFRKFRQKRNSHNEKGSKTLKAGRSTNRNYSSSSSSSLIEILDSPSTREEGFTEQETSLYLTFQQTLKKLQTMNNYYERRCNQCVKFDASHRFHGISRNNVSQTNSQTLQFFAKNELLGMENCSNLSCDVFYERMKLLLALEDYLLVSYELQL